MTGSFHHEHFGKTWAKYGLARPSLHPDFSLMSRVKIVQILAGRSQNDDAVAE